MTPSPTLQLEPTWGKHLDAPYGFRVLELTQGEIAVISEQDYPRASKMKWGFNRTHGKYGHARHNHYIGGGRRNSQRFSIALHQYILGTIKEIDHKNRNPLDNRRCNIRVTSRSANMHNARFPREKTRYKGIARNGTGWTAQLSFQGKKYQSKLMATEFEAALAYDELAIKFYGEHASTNFGNDHAA